MVQAPVGQNHRSRTEHPMAALHDETPDQPSRRPRGRARYVAPLLPRVAALYLRVSSEMQAAEGKASLPTQLAALRAKADEMGFAVDEAYIYTDAWTGEE